MKNLLALIFITTSFNLLALDLKPQNLKDGQVISIIGWRNLMPGPRILPFPVVDTPVTNQKFTHPLTVSFIAHSSGCTSADSFKVKFIEFTDYTFDKKTFRVDVIRVTQDLCKAVSRPRLITKRVSAPIEAFEGDVEFLVTPYSSVGIAY